MSLLFSSMNDPKCLWPIVIRSPHVHVGKSLRLAFANALGLPSSVVCSSPRALIGVLHELNSKGVSVVLAIDDIDIFFLGVAEAYQDACDFIFYLSRILSRVKIVGTFSRFEKISSIANDLKIENHCVIELQCWPATTQFFEFVKYVAKNFGLNEHQVSNEAFLQALFESTRGATGAILTSIKVLVMSGVLEGGKVASPVHLGQLWRF
ncbi:hypothetical protein [Pseudomonas sp. TWI628]|uniref:hypothetical protein n=1 Tax=Pseudomonas sp. TWI628 TaxID=3136788 RepID=UPI003208868D